MSDASKPPRNLRVALIVDQYTLVINQGTDYNISEGDRFMVFSIGQEIIDPESKASLGKLEVIKGVGRVVHVQEHMATIRSEKLVHKERKTVPGGSSGILWAQVVGRQVEKTEETVPVAFQSPEIGDLVKPV